MDGYEIRSRVSLQRVRSLSSLFFSKIRPAAECVNDMNYAFVFQFFFRFGSSYYLRELRQRIAIAGENVAEKTRIFVYSARPMQAPFVSSSHGDVSAPELSCWCGRS